MPFPHYRQMDQMDCGPTCIRIIARFYGKYFSAQHLREKTHVGRDGVSLFSIAEAANEIGMHSVGARLSISDLINDAPLPCILFWNKNHFVVLYKISSSTISLSKNVLKSIIGGRTRSDSKINPFVPEGKFIQSHERQYESQSYKTNRFSEYDFHISDPARGLIKYNYKEFSEYWLTTDGVNADPKGYALLMEPTTYFHEEENDKSHSFNLSQLLSYLWKFKSLFFQLILGMFVSSGLAILLPFLTQSVVDTGINTRNLDFISIVLIGQLALMIGQAVVGFLRSWILLHISTRLNLTILNEFIAKLLRLPMGFFDSKNFGDIMQRIGDHHRIESFLTGSSLNMILSLLSLLSFGFVLAYLNFQIFLLVIAASMAYIFWVAVFMRARKKLDFKKFEVAAKNQSQLAHIIHGIQDIKLANAETSMRWEWERTQAKLFKWGKATLKLSQVQDSGALLINEGKNILVTYMAAKSVVSGDMTLGGMISIQYILGQFNAPLSQATAFANSWQDAKLSLERMNEIQDLQDESTGQQASNGEWMLNKSIRLENISYSYTGARDVNVLNGINLLIPFGKTTAIVGGSGSGKTTLLKILLRYYDPTEGSISLVQGPVFSSLEKQSQTFVVEDVESEYPAKAVPIKDWRRRCGVVMQDGYIFSDTIAKNICIGESNIDRAKLRLVVKAANLDKYIDALPLGFETRIGTEGNGISQGQKQRILIARALYKSPDLLLLDEATNSLDAINEAFIVESLKKICVGKTVVIIAHRLSTVKYADQIVVMENGRIVETGNHRDLIALRSKYYHLVSKQMELDQ